MITRRAFRRALEQSVQYGDAQRGAMSFMAFNLDGGVVDGPTAPISRAASKPTKGKSKVIRRWNEEAGVYESVLVE